MKINAYNMESPRTGNQVVNQIIIETDKELIFQSYGTIIAKRERGFLGGTTLDKNYWDYSRTTLKYLKEFLPNNYNKKEIEQQINNGNYKIKDLNK
jgi:ribosomal protein L19